MSPHKYYFHSFTNHNRCSFAGKNKNSPKLCRRDAKLSFRNNRVCTFHHEKLYKLRRQNRI